MSNKDRATKKKRPSRGRGSAGRGRPSGLVIGLVAAGIVVLAGAAVIFSMMQSSDAPTRVTGIAENMETKGSPDAKVTLTEYSDYQ